MSIENIIIYFLLPILGYILVKLNRLEKKVIILMVMLRDRGFKIPDKTDTEIFLKSNNL